MAWWYSTYLTGPMLGFQNITYIHRNIIGEGEGENSLGSTTQHLRVFLKQANFSVL